MKMKHLVIGISVFVTSFGLFAPAHASLSQCPTNRVCLWANNGFAEYMGSRAPGGGIADLAVANQNRMDSWANITVTNAAGWDGLGGMVSCQDFHASSNDDNVNPFNSDELSSWKTNGGC